MPPLDGYNKINAARPANLIRGSVRANVTSNVMADTKGYNTPDTFAKGSQTITQALVESQSTISYALATGVVGTSESLSKVTEVAITNPLVPNNALNTTLGNTMIKTTAFGYTRTIDGRWIDSNGEYVTPSGFLWEATEVVPSSGDLSVPNPRTQDYMNYNTRLGLSNRTESLGMKTG